MDVGNIYNIVLVHLGNDFFGYINDCIEQIRKFNKCDIYFVSEKIHHPKISDKEVILVDVSKYKNSEKYNIFNNTTNLNRNFRGGFWKFATERFFVLEYLIEEYNLKNIFHLENDNLIYFDIGEYLKIFNDNYEIAAVFDNDIRCIPSFMYFTDGKELGHFTNFILKNNGVNDMELIPKYVLKGGNLNTLPILPDNYDKPFLSKSNHTTKNQKQFFNNIDKFNSIFDGAAIGQFLGGVDPRNQKGDSTGFINESTIFNVSLFDYSFEINEKGHKIPYLTYKNKKYRINNLHVHCKNLKKLM